MANSGQAALVRRVTFMVWHKEAKHHHGDDKDEVSEIDTQWMGVQAV